MKRLSKSLKAAISGTYSRDWKVSRVILRAANLNITDVTPLITHFIDSDDEFEGCASIYALSKFKDVSHIDSIYNVFKNVGFESKVGRIVASYILKFGKRLIKRN